MIDLDELERLLSKATPETWEYNDEDGGIEATAGGYVGWIQEHGNTRTILATGESRKHADGRAIVVLRNSAPDLLAELRTLRGQVATARKGALEEAAGVCFDAARDAIGPGAGVEAAALSQAALAIRALMTKDPTDG